MGDWRSELPCIAVTALSRPEDRKRALQVGYDEHVGKPFDPAGLCLAIAHLLRGRTQPKRRVEPSSATGFDPLIDPVDQPQRPHVLIAEDSESIGELLRTCLEEHGYRVSLAVSLSEAVALAKSDSVDLLLSDLQLKDGMSWDLLAKVGRRVPGVVMSGHDDEVYVAKSKAAGFSEYLVKPVDPDHVLSVVGRLLRAKSGEPDVRG